MVRYPKNPAIPQDPPKEPTLDSHLAPESSSIQNKENEPSERPPVAAAGNSKNLLRMLRLVLIVFGVLLLTLGVSFFIIRSHLYFAAVELKFRPYEFGPQGEKIFLSPNESLDLSKSKRFLKEFVNLYQSQTSISSDGKLLSLKIYALNEEKARSVIEDKIKQYRKEYIEDTGELLKKNLESIEKKYELAMRQLQDSLVHIAAIKPEDKPMVVDFSMKKKIDELAPEKILVFKQALSLLEEQDRQTGSTELFVNWPRDVKALMDVLVLKLSEMEFKQLIDNDSSRSYQKEIANYKSAMINLINVQLKRAKLDLSSSVLVSRHYFIQSQKDAINAVLNKRYAESTSLNSYFSEYIRLKNEAEELYLLLQKLTYMKLQITQQLAKGIEKEIVLEKKINVGKY